MLSYDQFEVEMSALYSNLHHVIIQRLSIQVSILAEDLFGLHARVIFIVKSPLMLSQIVSEI
jgi:hypothetical protein